jgi:LysR family transcriptional regulator, transcription activator of glutamate synthase operon
MEINYLKEFVVLAQTSNFLEAADILYSSQSTLSKHIKSMEAELGFALFDRTTRTVKINKFGRLFLPYAKKIVQIQDKYSANVKSNLETDREILNLGSIYGLAQYNITDTLVTFKKSRPQSTLNVLQASSKDLTEMLQQRKCELAFIRDIEDVGNEFIMIPYTSDVIVAVLPLTHPLANQKTIELKMLAKENFIMAIPNTMPYILAVKACEQSGFSPNVTYTDSEIENQVDFITRGMGVSLALKQIVLFLANPKIAIVNITPTVTSRINLCYLKDMKLSKAAIHFLSCLEPH